MKQKKIKRITFLCRFQIDEKVRRLCFMKPPGKTVGSV